MLKYFVILGLLFPSTVFSDIGIIDDPSQWKPHRSGPIPFPANMSPVVPETLEGGQPLDFGDTGSNLTIVLPDQKGQSVHEKALPIVAGWIPGRGLKNAIIISAKDLTDELCNRHILLLGTQENNSIAQQIISQSKPDFFKNIQSGGYHIKSLQNPWNKSTNIILALGKDPEGAWRAATIMYYSIHGVMHTGPVGKLRRWQVDLPEGNFWAPFEAKHSGVEEMLRTRQDITPKPPKIQFGVRAWGLPTPTLATYEKMIQALKLFGVNTIVVIPGGWQDLKNAGEICRQAIDCTFSQGIYTILYVGNDLQGHKVFPLTSKHKDMVMAVKDHPGLLGWQLYNQLTSELSPDERKLLQEQVEWLCRESEKPVGMEVVWGHDVGPIPENKVNLIRDLLRWGVTEIHHDYAPIGGWSKKHVIQLWQERLQCLSDMNIIPMAVLQAHIPFIEPTLPSRAELRNQFWWCVAAGAQAYFFEVAYSFNHFSNRGLLTWTLEPVPDGRLHEVGELAKVIPGLEEMLLTTQHTSQDVAGELNVKVIEGEQNSAVTVRPASDRNVYTVFVNKDLDHVTPVHFVVSSSHTFSNPVDVLTGKQVLKQGSNNAYRIDIPAGGGVCLKLRKSQ